MKIFLASSSFRIDLFEKIVIPALEKSDEIELLILIKNRKWRNLNLGQASGKLRWIDQTLFTKKKSLAFSDKNDLECLHKILNDQHVYLLSDRSNFFWKNGYGMLNYTRYVTSLFITCLNFLRLEKIDLAYFRTTPHSVIEWVFAHVAEYLGIPVVVNELAGLPWRHGLYLGFRKDRLPFRLKNSNGRNQQFEKDLLERYIENNQASYDKALPTYEKKRLERNKDRPYSLFNDIKKWYKYPHFILNKWKCYKKYSMLSEIPDLNIPFVVFFLQFQPERTTLPEGFGYTQQILAILALRQALPANYSIYIKEHPSIFTNVCKPSQRHPSFYEDLKSIPGTKLIDVDFNTFKLIDNSLCVATITTGSVGRQALLRGVPVVYFGRSIFSDSFAIHHYVDAESLHSFIDRHIKKIVSRTEIIQNVLDQIREQYDYSISGISDKSDFSDIYHPSVREYAHLSMLGNIIEKKVIYPGDIS